MAKRASKPAADAAAAPSGPAHPVTLLEQVIGQAGAKRVLAAALKSGRVHHAWIFHGPAGVGKFTAAYAFAAAMLDPTTAAGLTGEVEPEPGSAVQELCRSGNHPDLHVITKELAAMSREKGIRDGKQTSIAKDVLDEFLIEPSSRTRILQGSSLMGKVFIIDEAEMVTPGVQNILLKTMEEPPSGTAIILVTSNEDRLLPTIRSRCQRVGFVPLDEREMDKWIKQAGIELDAKRGLWLRTFAAGSPGLAKLAIDADLFAWHETLSPLLASVDKGQFPAELGSTLAKLINERAEAEVKANPDASKDGANKTWARRMLAFVAEHYRSRLRATAGTDPDDAGTQRWLANLDAVQAAEGFLASNVNMTMLLENLAAQLAVEPVAA
jgi:DNA polymerase-3 subunit delta'